MTVQPGSGQLPDESYDSLVTVLDFIRSRAAKTRPELGQRSGLGRTVVVQRVEQLLAVGLLVEEANAPSTGGRPARELRFRSEAGNILACDLGATSIAVGIADLSGQLMTSYEEPSDIADGPEKILGRVEQLFDDLLDPRSPSDPPIWGVGIGLPGPVEYATGKPISPPIMPGWDGYPVRQRFASRYDVPVWVDNDVNLMALGELRLGLAVGEQDVIFLKIGSGIGAGLVSAGRLHRGAKGAAGDIGHVAVVDDATVICRCGNTGCLEAIAGGAVLGRLATEAATDGRSPFLSRRLTESAVDALQAKDLADAAHHGDALAVQVFGRSGQYIGGTLATIVNFYNPSLIVLGGGVTAVGDLLLASIRQTVYRRSLPLATRDLRIAQSALGDKAGLYGAAFVVIDELFSRHRMALWIDQGTPVHRPEIADAV